jgi:hypothetical protein
MKALKIGLPVVGPFAIILIITIVTLRAENRDDPLSPCGTFVMVEQVMLLFLSRTAG